MKEKAKHDYTYCYGMNCKEKCWRYAGNYEFSDDRYSFVAGNIEPYKCIEEENK